MNDNKVGIAIAFSVILTILCFACGYSAGYKDGKVAGYEQGRFSGQLHEIKLNAAKMTTPENLDEE